MDDRDNPRITEADIEAAAAMDDVEQAARFLQDKAGISAFAVADMELPLYWDGSTREVRAILVRQWIEDELPKAGEAV
jgi:hypothetical protein